jgi:hypothetical protein
MSPLCSLIENEDPWISVAAASLPSGEGLPPKAQFSVTAPR